MRPVAVLLSEAELRPRLVDQTIDNAEAALALAVAGEVRVSRSLAVATTGVRKDTDAAVDIDLR